MKKTGRSRAPRSDCWGEEDEEDAAVLLPQADPLLVVCNVGGERRRLGQRTAMARSRLGFLQVGGKRGARVARAAGVHLKLQRGPESKEGRDSGDEVRRQRGRQRTRSIQREEDGDFAKKPLPAFFFSVFFLFFN